MHRDDYLSAPSPACKSSGSALAQSIGRIHRPGTENADAWLGYIEGAIRSGENVAGLL
jgi:monoamine oxidase